MSAEATSAEIVGAEFVTEEFTEVENEEIESIVRALREAIGDDDRLETLLRSAPDREVLTERDSVERSDPEPLTQQVLIEPLFFGVLDERPSDRPERVRGISLYEGVPYLNGGLFRPVESGDRGFDDRDFDVRDSVLESIIDLLERYSFSADGGSTDLDPSVLGNVSSISIGFRLLAGPCSAIPPDTSGVRF